MMIEVCWESYVIIGLNCQTLMLQCTLFARYNIISMALKSFVEFRNFIFLICRGNWMWFLQLQKLAGRAISTLESVNWYWEKLFCLEKHHDILRKKKPQQIKCKFYQSNQDMASQNSGLLKQFIYDFYLGSFNLFRINSYSSPFSFSFLPILFVWNFCLISKIFEVFFLHQN